MENELKPCPFCGGSAEIETDWDLTCDGYEPIGYYVVCDECMNQTATYKDEEDAIEAWNRRIEDE